MSIFGVLDLASRAMQVVQGGVRNTSHNIANVNTPGYSRQRQVLQAALSIPHPAGQIGTGVEQRTIQRTVDEFVQRELVEQYTTQGSVDVRAQVIAGVEELLNEQKSEGLRAALDSFYDAFQDLATASNPGAPTERENVRSAARALIDTIHRLDADLRALQRSTDRDIEGVIPEVNSLAARIQTLNAEIQRQEIISPANDLRDERDEALRELAQLVDVTYFEDQDGGIVVSLRNGLPLVEGNRARTLSTTSDPTNTFDPTFKSVLWVDGASSVDVTGTISGGRLGGLLESRDVMVASVIRELDVLAYNLGSTVNTVHAAGVGLGGASNVFFAALPQVEDAAQSLALSAAVTASTDAIAAGLSSDVLDNRNALALAALRTTQSALYQLGDPPGPATGPTRSVLEHAAYVAADAGTQSRTLQQAKDTQTRVVENLENRRAEVSGVSLDEEVTSLIRLQAAYQANARVISTMDRLLQDVVNLIG